MPHKKYFLFILIFGFMFFGFIGLSAAQEPTDIVFPVSELGNCANKDECRTYCEDPANKEVCLDFAEKHNLIPKEQIKAAKKVLKEGGPGGCRNEKDCRTYCDNPDNADECLAFAEKEGFMPKEELERAKKFIKISREGGPGGCRGEKDCRTYCDNPDNADECLAFAEREGLVSPKELKIAREVLKQGGPGGCRGEECRKYCQDPAHVKECVDFGKKHGLIGEEDAKRAELMAQGGPGGCRGPECRDYCEKPENQESCLAFAEEHNLIPKEELERAKKIMGKAGPGGCRGPECRDYCEKPENQEACLAFAEEEGLMPKEELERAKNFIKLAQEPGPGGCKGAECRTYCEDPAHQEECFAFAKEHNLISEKEQERFKRGMELGQKVKESGGPGACKSEEECRAYCGDPEHVEECIAFGAAHSDIPLEEAERMLKKFNREIRGDEFRPEREFEEMESGRFRKFEEFRQLEHEFRGKPEFGPPQMMPGAEGEMPQAAPQFIGPGGCASPSECIKYCAANKEECFSFGPPGKPEALPKEGGVPPGRMEMPRLRQDIIRDFKPTDLPEGFEQKPETEKREFFKQKFEEFRGAPPEQFPGRPGEFPGKPEEFPAGPKEFKPESLPFRPEDLRKIPEGMSLPPEGVPLTPPTGTRPAEEVPPTGAPPQLRTPFPILPEGKISSPGTVLPPPNIQQFVPPTTIPQAPTTFPQSPSIEQLPPPPPPPSSFNNDIPSGQNLSFLEKAALRTANLAEAFLTLFR